MSVHKNTAIAGLKEVGSETQIDIMTNLATNRLIQHMINDTTENKSGQAKFDDASAKLEAEIKEGINNGTGLFAAKLNASYTPAEYDAKGKRTKDGYTTDQPDSTAVGYTFLAADSFIHPGTTSSPESIRETFFVQNEFSDIRGGDYATLPYTNLLLQIKLSDNLNSDKSILSQDQKRNILYDAQSGKYDPQSIPDNLKLLIVQAKSNNSNITTKEVMDMVINATTEKGEFKSYSDLRWSPTHEDLTKKITGSCSPNTKNNFAKCLTELARIKGVNLNEYLLSTFTER